VAIKCELVEMACTGGEVAPAVALFGEDADGEGDDAGLRAAGTR
jgi:hypothetical protein